MEAMVDVVFVGGGRLTAVTATVNRANGSVGGDGGRDALAAAVAAVRVGGGRLVDAD